MSCQNTPCDGCHAGCCRAFAVPISGADVLRIEEAGHDFWTFACRWADPTGEIARRYAPQIHFSDEPDTPFVLCMMQEASVTVPGTDRCRFLTEEPPSSEFPKGRGSCSIHEHRPGTCRSFPMKFNETRELVQLHPVVNPPRAKVHDVYQLCPRPWTPEDVNGIEAAGALAAAEFEMSFFAKVVAIWNRKPREWTAFPDFLRIVYNGRVRIEEVEEPVILPMRRPDDTQKQAIRRAA